ncbi:MAG: hypothetical protein IKT87_02970 [Bacteroidaceae bacterium]|nr:hypothetical protein [Bacteroidaceae bacterium]
MDNNFTEEVKAWLDMPASERDYDKGALYLLQLSNNQIMYRNLSRNAKKHGDFIEHHIRKYMKFRLERLTHEQVQEMQKKVDKIAILRNLDASSEGSYASSGGENGEGNDSASGSTETADSTDSAVSASPKFKAGIRADHDLLPAEIQALYVENASILQKMRELHLTLRNLSLDNVACPDSERYPFLKELIELDKKYHSNWKAYDSFSMVEGASNVAEQRIIEDERSLQRSIYRQINLTKGRYKKSPSEALKEKLVDLYKQLASPEESLTEELIALGVLSE